MDTNAVVLALTADDDRYAAVRAAAEDAALRDGAALILYDWDAPMLLGDPLPSVWSADGTDKAVPDRLDAEALEAAGRSAIADQVRQAGSRGIEVSAWLPSTHEAEALAQYAVDHGVKVLYLPADVAELADLGSKVAPLGIRVDVVAGS